MQISSYDDHPPAEQYHLSPKAFIKTRAMLKQQTPQFSSFRQNSAQYLRSNGQQNQRDLHRGRASGKFGLRISNNFQSNPKKNGPDLEIEDYVAHGIYDKLLNRDRRSMGAACGSTGPTQDKIRSKRALSKKEGEAKEGKKAVEQAKVPAKYIINFSSYRPSHQSCGGRNSISEVQPESQNGKKQSHYSDKSAAPGNIGLLALKFQSALLCRQDMKRLLDFISTKRAAELLIDPVFVKELNSATFSSLMQSQELRKEMSHQIQSMHPEKYDPFKAAQHHKDLNFIFEYTDKPDFIRFLEGKKSLDQVKGNIFWRMDQKRSQMDLFKETDQRIYEHFEKKNVMKLSQQNNQKRNNSCEECSRTSSIIEDRIDKMQAKITKSPYLCLDDLKEYMGSEAIKSELNREERIKVSNQRRQIERQATQFNNENLQMKARAKRLFLEKKQMLEMQMKQNSMPSMDGQSDGDALVKMFIDNYQNQNKVNNSELEQKIRQFEINAIKKNDHETKLLVLSMRDHLYNNQSVFLKNAKIIDRKRGSRDSQLSADRVNKHNINSFAINRKSSIEEEVRKERKYVQKVYKDLQFLNAIKQSNGIDPSNFIVSDKDKHILEHTRSQVEKQIDSVVVKVKNLDTNGVPLVSKDGGCCKSKNKYSYRDRLFEQIRKSQVRQTFKSPKKKAGKNIAADIVDSMKLKVMEALYNFDEMENNDSFNIVGQKRSSTSKSQLVLKNDQQLVTQDDVEQKLDSAQIYGNQAINQKLPLLNTGSKSSRFQLSHRSVVTITDHINHTEQVPKELEDSANTDLKQFEDQLSKEFLINKTKSFKPNLFKNCDIQNQKDIVGVSSEQLNIINADTKNTIQEFQIIESAIQPPDLENSQVQQNRQSDSKNRDIFLNKIDGNQRNIIIQQEIEILSKSGLSGTGSAQESVQVEKKVTGPHPPADLANNTKPHLRESKTNEMKIFDSIGQDQTTKNESYGKQELLAVPQTDEVTTTQGFSGTNPRNKSFSQVAHTTEDTQNYESTVITSSEPLFTQTNLKLKLKKQKVSPNNGGAVQEVRSSTISSDHLENEILTKSQYGFVGFRGLNGSKQQSNLQYCYDNPGLLNFNDQEYIQNPLNEILVGNHGHNALQDCSIQSVSVKRSMTRLSSSVMLSEKMKAQVPEQITNFNDNIVDVQKMRRFDVGVDQKIKTKYVNQNDGMSFVSLKTFLSQRNEKMAANAKKSSNYSSSKKTPKVINQDLNIDSKANKKYLFNNSKKKMITTKSVAAINSTRYRKQSRVQSAQSISYNPMYHHNVGTNDLKSSIIDGQFQNKVSQGCQTKFDNYIQTQKQTGQISVQNLQLDESVVNNGAVNLTMPINHLPKDQTSHMSSQNNMPSNYQTGLPSGGLRMSRNMMNKFSCPTAKMPLKPSRRHVIPQKNVRFSTGSQYANVAMSQKSIKVQNRLQTNWTKQQAHVKFTDASPSSSIRNYFQSSYIENKRTFNNLVPQKDKQLSQDQQKDAHGNQRDTSKSIKNDIKKILPSRSSINDQSTYVYSNQPYYGGSMIVGGKNTPQTATYSMVADKLSDKPKQRQLSLLSQSRLSIQNFMSVKRQKRSQGRSESKLNGVSEEDQSSLPQCALSFKKLQLPTHNLLQPCTTDSNYQKRTKFTNQREIIGSRSSILADNSIQTTAIKHPLSQKKAGSRSSSSFQKRQDQQEKSAAGLCLQGSSWGSKPRNQQLRV